jgi:hypothetical protein
LPGGIEDGDLMPFTFSHPAIVLPLRLLPAHWFSLTGLVIGSITPDFEYFLRMRISSRYSHTLSGLFWFDLPLGLLLTFIFHLMVRKQLFLNLPTPLRNRLSIFLSFDYWTFFKKNFLIAIISILIGAASHLLWDGFTHRSGFFVNAVPFLKQAVHFLNLKTSIYRTLQHASTLAGELVVAFVLYKLPVQKSDQAVDRKYWVWFLALSGVVTLVRVFISFHDLTYGDILVTVISANLISLILSPIAIAVINKVDIY